ncbi:hypothetical protein JCM4814A_53010 [Streptomyces phaeofaciens JCM 4814]|uniref:Uncharacterized protein n=1 Tax=Streptomyces phaeofaciens TaxID=68254 RepID=A0A918HME2_9ACTN|nr:hypothetical protein GCM10010226_68730 [Streptomyces phaeofaciens]
MLSRAARPRRMKYRFWTTRTGRILTATATATAAAAAAAAAGIGIGTRFPAVTSALIAFGIKAGLALGVMAGIASG